MDDECHLLSLSNPPPYTPQSNSTIMSSSSTRGGRHRSSTVSNSYAGHATLSPLPSHLTDEYFTRVLRGGKSRRMSMSEASQSSCNSSSSSETIKAPVTELSFPASSSLPNKRE